MATKKYLSLERLTEYDELIKDVIDDGDTQSLSSAKSYTNTEIAKITSGTTVVPEAEHAETSDVANAVAWTNVTGKPSTFVPSSHSHAISEVTDLQTTIDTINEEIDGSIKSLSVSGKTITFTKNDGTTGTITTQDTNTDTKVTQTATTTDAEYPLLASNTASRTATGTEAARFASGVTLNPSDKSITATTFIGALSGNATSATKATKDASGNTITSTYETKTDASAKLTEAKIYTDTVAATKADSTHNHDSTYDAKGAADTALASAKEYTNTKTSGMATTTVVDNKISSHNTSTTAHGDIRDLISALTTKVNNFLDVDDTTTDQLSEVLTLIENNKGTLESLTSGKVNVSDIVDNLTTASATKVLSANQGVAIKALIDALQAEVDGKADEGHEHAIADVSGLQTALDGKAASSHGTHVSFDSTNKPKMDGTAAFGTSSKVARADHVHPTDTSRASQTEFDTHVADTTAHITSTERTNWGTAYTHSQAAHAPSNAEKNQNAFSNIKVGTITVAADTTTDTVEFAGSNVTITPDATNDKITFAVASGSTSTAGILKLTNSTSSTSTTTAATPSSVKSAYDLANTAKTAAATAQATADGKANASHTHKVVDITDLTATAEELNYMDGVTSNVQTQLDGKAASGHGHSTATTSAAGFMSADMVTKLNGIATGANKTVVDSALSSTSTNPVQNKVVNSAITAATSAITANTNSINSHSTAISNLQTAVAEIQEITSEEIQSLFA